MKRLKWGRLTILLVVILGICWFFFQGVQKSETNVDTQPLQVAELPKTGLS
ncbi:MAG: D-alanyl-D-alanine carboxypeptidase, partial [Bacillus mycoides]